LVPYLQESYADSAQRSSLLTLVEKVVAQHPDDIKVLELYGDILRLSGRQSDAVAQYKKIIALKPGNYEPWQQLLYSYTDRADADSLIYYSEKAARLFPNQSTIHYLNGIGHQNKKEYPAAIRSINRAIDLQPEENAELLADMYSSLGDVYNTMKEYKQSDSAFEQALRLNPKNPTVLNNYAYYLSERNQRLNDAERMSKQSLTLRPAEGTFLDTYGWILYQQGKYEEAGKYIQQAIDAAKGSADATLWEHMGAIQYKLGNVVKAVDAWKLAKEKGSERPQLDKMIADRKLYE
jgi:Tfp pilus assembly protein PilF